MASLGEISVTLGLNTRQFNEGLRTSQAKLQQMGTQMRTTINRAGQLGIAMGAAGAAVAIAFGRQQLQSIDNLAKMSDRLGLATEELQGLRRAAELTGVASSSLDMGIQRMTRRIAEAATGSGEAKDAIKELGLEAGDLAGMTVDQQFREIAGAMEGVDNQSTRVRLAFKLFDSEGVALVNTLKLGKDGLQDVRNELDQYGIAISRIDAAQVEAANDAITRAAANLQGVMQRATVDAAPYIEAIADYFTEATAEAGNFGDLASGAIENILTPAKWLLDGIHAIKVAFKGATWVAQSFGTGLLSAFSYIQTAIGRAGESVIGLTKTIADAYNRIPMLPDIDTSGIEDLRAEFTYSADQAAIWRKEMADSAAQTGREFHDMLMQPLPSQQIDAFMSDIEQRAATFRERMREGLNTGGNETGRLNPPGGEDDDTSKASAPKIDTSPITDAQASMKHLIDLAGDVPEVEFEVDMDAAESLSSWLDALENTGVDLGSLGIDKRELEQLRETLTNISNRGIDPLAVEIDSRAVETVRTALSRLGDDTELSRRVEIDTEEIEFAQGLLDRMAETHFDPKALQITTEDATRAGAVLRRLQATKLDGVELPVEHAQLTAAQRALQVVVATQIPGKRVAVDDSQIHQSMTTLDLLREKLAAMPAPDQLGAQVNQQRQREQEMEAQRAQMEQRIAMIQQALMTERELEVQQHEQRIAELQSFGERRLANVEQINALIEKENARHEGRLLKLNKRQGVTMLGDQRSFLDSMIRADEQGGKAMVSTMAGAFEQISAAGARENKALFEINKIAGIANAVISTQQGAAEALKLGWPMGPIAMAAILANGAARIAAIKSTSFGSGGAGGGAAAPSVVGGSTAPPVDASGGGGGAKTLNINLTGGSAEQKNSLRQIMDGINEAMNDGYKFDRIKMVDS